MLSRGRQYVIDGESMTLAEAKRAMPVYGEDWLKSALASGVNTRKELATLHTHALNTAARKLKAKAKKNSPFHINQQYARAR
jgi:hypothetical protein